MKHGCATGTDELDNDTAFQHARPKLWLVIDSKVNSIQRSASNGFDLKNCTFQTQI
jgi:hypothetical protein